MTLATLDDRAMELLTPTDEDYVMQLVWEGCDHEESHLSALDHYYDCAECDGKFAAETLRFLENYYRGGTK